MFVILTVHDADPSTGASLPKILRTLVWHGHLRHIENAIFPGEHGATIGNLLELFRGGDLTVSPEREQLGYFSMACLYHRCHIRKIEPPPPNLHVIIEVEDIAHILAQNLDNDENDDSLLP